MKVAFRRSFERDLRKIRDPALRKRVQEAIERVEAATALRDIPNLERLSGASGFGRIRIGDFRLGVAFDGDEIDFVRFLHRREIYRFFP